MSTFRRRGVCQVIAPCLLTLLSSRSALACAVCFGSPDSSLTQGAKAGILILLGVVAAVLTGIVAVALFWARRARALEQGALDRAEGERAHA